MQNSQIVKKRLNDLKKLSQNLKQSTEATAQIDVNLIKAIISITKSNGKSPSQSLNGGMGANSQSNLSINSQSPQLNRSMSSSLIRKHMSKTNLMQNNINFNQNQQSEPLFSELGNVNKQGLDYRKISSSSPIDNEQLIFLRQQNQSLEMQLKQARQQLSQYRNKFSEKIEQQLQKIKQIKEQQQKEQQPSQSNQPFFKLNEQLKIFYTQIQVKKSDYPKIQYTSYPVELSLDKITIRKQVNTVNKQQAANVKQLDLSYLTSVDYFESSHMVLFFNNQSSLFIQFANSETMHRWDLAMFINHKILKSLNQQKLFYNEFNAMPNKMNSQLANLSSNLSVQRQSRQSSHQQLRRSQQYSQKQAIKKFLQSKKKYVQSQKSLKMAMLKKISSLKGNQMAQSIQFPNNSNEKIEDGSKPKLSENINKSQNVKQEMERNEQNSQMERRAQQMKIDQQIRKQQQKRIEQRRIEQKRIEQQKRIREQQKSKLNSAISYLKKGKQMTKYTKSAFSPHNKIVYLSQDNLKLCWKDIDSEQFKFVLVSQIESVSRGEIGPGIKKHIEQKRIKNPNCFITLFTTSKDRKSIQFGMTNLRQMEIFQENLIIFLSFFKKGGLAHQ